MAYCKGEGNVKSQNFLKNRTFNFAINGFYSFKISEVLYHKRYFDAWGGRIESETVRDYTRSGWFWAGGIELYQNGYKNSNID